MKVFAMLQIECEPRLSSDEIKSLGNGSMLQGHFDVLQDRIEGNGPETDVAFVYEIDGTRIGYASVKVNSAYQTISWNKFFPLRHIKGDAKGLGIGTLAHVKTLLSLMDIFDISPAWSVIPNGDISEKRKDHLDDMDLKYSDIHTFASYLEHSLQLAKEKHFNFQNPFE